MFLLQDFNTNKYSVPLNEIEDIVPDIPNITVTTIPLKSVKARYYLNAKKYDRALELVEEGTSANPYLFYSELLKSQIYSAKGQIDSAKHYAQKAFFGLPNNALHAATYLNLLSQTRDANGLEDAFELLTAKGDLNNWKNYLIIANTIMTPSDPTLIKRAQKAVELFPTNGDIKSLFNLIAVGQEKINQAQQFSASGLNFFNQQNYAQAAEQFEKALALNPYEYAFYENAATANYLIGDLNKAQEQIDKVINEMNPLNGKCEYIKALIFIKMGDPVGACPLLATARDSGYTQADGIFQQYCN
jgi:tetratricopeptide (TPR) repeat protein